MPIAVVASVSFATADTQIKPGAGNFAVEATGHQSPLVDSAYTTLQTRVGQIQNKTLRTQTLDALTPETCVAHRANLTIAMQDQIVASLLSNGLVNPADAANIDGGVKAGIFPPLLKDGSACPSLPLDFYGARAAQPAAIIRIRAGCLFTRLSINRVRSTSPAPIAASTATRTMPVCLLTAAVRLPPLQM